MHSGEHHTRRETATVMSLSDFFAAGGPGMYFHLVTGLGCIAFAVQAGRAPSPRRTRVTWGLARP
jgi:hypothetical protein